MNLIGIFKELNSTNSVVDKEAILTKNKDNEYLKKILKWNLDPYALFQFNKMPCQFETEGEIGQTQEWKFGFLEGLLNDLKGRYTTGNKAKETVIAVFKLFDREHFDLYSKVLLKESIGVGARTVNKVWPSLIPSFELMLAPNELPDLTKVKYPLYLQPKLDGYRCVYKDGLLWSRKGKPFGNKNLATHFKSLFGVTDYVLDGELYVHGINFNKLQTILNTEDTPLPSSLKYVVYDCVPVKDWLSQKTKIIYENRLKTLREVVNSQIADHKKVIDISNDLINTSAEAVSLYKEYLNKGYEGCMLKAPDGLYKWKRTTIRSGEMLKVKPFKSIDLAITGVYAGEGLFEGMAGGVDCDYSGVTVSIGSGFDVATRKKMAESPNDFIGKTIEIKYFEETEEGSLRHPTFQRFREEKD
jgi:ATP-dependent DNA ligase